jgi:hypothetical protein
MLLAAERTEIVSAVSVVGFMALILEKKLISIPFPHAICGLYLQHTVCI